ncbi:MAG: FAD:protein FMN transferase [Patescibacteria group bacterium]|nr:FAD:protein FMN transferase [Patescibacteria group bacterium]
MKETRIIMGMPITMNIPAGDRPLRQAAVKIAEKAFDHFVSVDNRFSTYKYDSEMSRINRGEHAEDEWSDEMKEIIKLCENTKKDTDGYFDIVDRQGKLDPSGIVKGWAIRNAADIIRSAGFGNFLVDAGGDIQAVGKNEDGRPWTVGIRDPFKQDEIVKKVVLDNAAIATSGTYIRGQHIYDPKDKTADITDIVSLTVVGDDIYEADRFATAAFAMGKAGIDLIERLPGLEGYMIDREGIATMTTGFYNYEAP